MRFGRQGGEHHVECDEVNPMVVTIMEGGALTAAERATKSFSGRRCLGEHGDGIMAAVRANKRGGRRTTFGTGNALLKAGDGSIWMEHSGGFGLDTDTARRPERGGRS